MKKSQNGFPLPNSDQEAGNKHEAALVRRLAPLPALAASPAWWAAGWRRGGHAAAPAVNFWAAVSFS